MVDLDWSASRHFTFRHLIHDAGKTSGLTSNMPKEADTFDAMAKLASTILEPVLEDVGDVRVTYGFCSPERAKLVAKWWTYQPGDQHVGHERNRKGDLICDRGGFAVDIATPSSVATAAIIVAELPWDRIYFYGDNRPLHVSVPADDRAPAKCMVDMRAFPGSRPQYVRTPLEFLQALGSRPG